MTENQQENRLPFPSVIGQRKARLSLFKALSGNRLSHGYLFAGPPGTGRSALAIELARTLSCTGEIIHSAYDECECNACYNMRKWQHPNLTMLFPLPPMETKKDETTVGTLFEELRKSKAEDPYSQLQFKGSGQILIWQIRELRNKMSLAPDRDGTRVAIIQPADRMNKHASNALLKLLEEPPKRCTLILITDSLKSLPATIVSRCQVLRFAPLGTRIIAEELQNRTGVSEKKANPVARMARGNYSLAVSLLDEGLSDQLDESLAFLRATAVNNAAQISEYVTKLSRGYSKQEITNKLNNLSVWLKDAMITQSFDEEHALTYLSTTGHIKVIQKIADRYSTEQLSMVWKEIEEAKLGLDSNVMISLVISSLAVKMFRIFR
ncbi:MAG: AAA family ATPase [Calditrichaeota bacterium]|nr:AAA family ATPase [Calditrichota bacterium]